MADTQKLFRVLVKQVNEYEVFVAVDHEDDAEDVAIDLVANDAVDASNVCDPEVDRIYVATEDDVKAFIFLDKNGKEVDVK